nr:LysM peptidoglycan-binding domain-containing protein [Nitrosomonas sp. JL21]
MYHVKKDESIREIAERYNTTVKQLKTINGIARHKNLTLGQKILVPQVITDDVAINDKNSNRLQNYHASVHIVRKGDTLYDIAKKYGTTVKKIKRWNSSDENLSIGQKLVITKS